MKARIVRIGNSQGIRIPKPLLEAAGIEGEVDLSARRGVLTVRAVRRTREGWAEAFRMMSLRDDDQLLDESPNLTGWDEEDWEWE